MSRDASLRRLLASLARANYDGDDVDLYINIDTPNEPDRRHHAVRAVAKNFRWPHGDKVVTLRQQHLGLADSWFQAVEENAHSFEFVAIFEDDMELHAEFYTLFSLARRCGAMKRDTTSAFCLHPDDWEVRVRDRCDPAYSQVFYESPEPCNWGPIWKSQEWFNYGEFVAAMRARGEQPIVPRNIAYNYNTYLSMRLDVQSPWVWRYNWERSKRHVRYHAGCLSERRPVVCMAKNHREPGTHFKTTFDRKRSDVCLKDDVDHLWRQLSSEHAFTPQPFVRYEKFATPLIPVGK